MNDLSPVRAQIATVELAEEAVDTSQPVEALAELRRVIDGLDLDPQVHTWLTEEHFAGGVLLTAATMNKRAEVSGKGNPFNRQSRAVLIGRFNRWARALEERTSACPDTSSIAELRRRLAAFREDPVNVEL